MSYTTFDVATENAAWKPDAEPKTITVTVKVTNTGSCAGKEVVQIYAACPFGKLKKERKRLVAFGKTALLQPGESETLHLKVPTVLLESYRTGKAVYCMEAGDYDFLVGTSSRDVTLAARLTLDKTVETEHLTNICPLLDALKEIQPEEEKEERWRAEREQMWEEKKAEIPLLFLDEKGLIRDGKSAEEMYKILKFGETNAAEAKECDANGCEFEAETTEAKEDAGNCKCGAEQPKWEERRRKAREKAAELAQKLTPEEKTALVCGRSSGSKEIIGAAAITVPGAAGETTASLLEKYGVANVILADGGRHPHHLPLSEKSVGRQCLQNEHVSASREPYFWNRIPPHRRRRLLSVLQCDPGRNASGADIRHGASRGSRPHDRRRAGGVRRDPLACTGHEHPPQSALRTQLRILF